MIPADLSVVAPILAAVISAALLQALLQFPGLLVDPPNQRSLHSRPVPCTGGIAIVIGAFAPAIFLLPEYFVLYACALTIACVSLLDDWRKLPPLPRFGAQALLAMTFSWIGIGQLSALEIAFLTLAIVWVANLYNFMDGSDGLAGGMAVIGFSTCSLGAWIGGNVSLALLCGSIAAASLPFLARNFHPARIFMGDVGAVTLGFCAAAIGALGWREGVWSPFFPVFAFSMFIGDASLTLMKRIRSRQRIWQPHRDHYYQKLVRMGLGHRNTALACYLIMAISACGAIATMYMDGVTQLIAIVSWGAVLMGIAHRIDRRWLRMAKEAG